MVRIWRWHAASVRAARLRTPLVLDMCVEQVASHPSALWPES